MVSIEEIPFALVYQPYKSDYDLLSYHTFHKLFSVRINGIMIIEVADLKIFKIWACLIVSGSLFIIHETLNV